MRLDLHIVSSFDIKHVSLGGGAKSGALCPAFLLLAGFVVGLYTKGCSAIGISVLGKRTRNNDDASDKGMAFLIMLFLASLNISYL